MHGEGIIRLYTSYRDLNVSVRSQSKKSVIFISQSIFTLLNSLTRKYAKGQNLASDKNKPQLHPQHNQMPYNPLTRKTQKDDCIIGLIQSKTTLA